jgi:excisionase family DNA binding protein
MSIESINPSNHRLLSAKVLAPELGMSVWTLYALARENRIPHRRLGRSIRFSRSEIEAWLRGTGVDVPPQQAH